MWAYLQKLGKLEHFNTIWLQLGGPVWGFWFTELSYFGPLNFFGTLFSCGRKNASYLPIGLNKTESRSWRIYILPGFFFSGGNVCLFNVYVCVCAQVYVCAPHACRCLRRPIEGIRSPGTKVPGSCELPGTRSGNQTWNLCKSIKCS